MRLCRLTVAASRYRLLMDGDEPVRVGFLGAGLIARYHAMQLARSPEAHRIVAVHDPDAARAAGVRPRPTAVTRRRASPEVVDASDAVIVCTPTAEHLDGVREVVRCPPGGVLREAALGRPAPRR